MRRIYVDTNIYLNFFKSQANVLLKLLPALLEIKEHLFITRQIRDEINRNKLDVTRQTLEPVREKVKFREWNLPEILSSKHGKAGPSWSDQAKKEEENVLSLMVQVLEDVAASKDPISVALNPVLALAASETAEQVTAARLRREFGNPPGKKSDPLGDRLSWAQFLDVLKAGDELWIVSNDGDYYSSMDGKIYLNAFLMQELSLRGIEFSKVHVFDNLARALSHFGDEVKVKSLPAKKVLEAAAKEEREMPNQGPFHFAGALPAEDFLRMPPGSSVSDWFRLENQVFADGQHRLWALNNLQAYADQPSVQLMSMKDLKSKKQNPFWPEKGPKPPVKAAKWAIKRREAREAKEAKKRSEK
jgi:hypothetical protein